MIQVLVLEPKATTSEPKIAARAVMAPEPEDNIGTALISCSASSEQTSLADIRSKRKAVVVLWHSTCKKQTRGEHGKECAKHEDSNTVAEYEFTGRPKKKAKWYDNQRRHETEQKHKTSNA